MKGRSAPQGARPAVALAALAAALVCAEAGVRLTGADWRLLAPRLYYQAVDLPVHRESDVPGLLYELKPGAAETLNGKRVTVNALGLRGPERAARKPAGVIRIVCLGNSNTYGAGVGDDEAYPAQLERLLNERRRGAPRYEVWNAGVSAYNLLQSSLLARRILERYSPDLLVLQAQNTGRRAFLLGRPFARYFEADPSLFLENLTFVPFGGTRLGLALLERSRFYRALVIACNPLRRQGAALAHERSWNAVRDLVAAAGGTPVVLLYNPGTHRGSGDRLGLKTIALDDHLPADFSADHLVIHPPPYVYRWYAEVLARELPLR